MVSDVLVWLQAQEVALAWAVVQYVERVSASGVGQADVCESYNLAAEPVFAGV
jgi:hypothetical protein